MASFAPFISTKTWSRRYCCLRCEKHIAIDQAECDHCGRTVSDQDRESMKENHRQLGVGKGPLVLLISVLIILFLILLIAFATWLSA